METVQHVLLVCPAYSIERGILLEEVREQGQARLSLEGLLSFSVPSAWRSVFQFLKNTGLFVRI